LFCPIFIAPSVDVSLHIIIYFQDGVFLVSQHPDIVQNYKKVILTPNVVEYARLHQAVVSYITLDIIWPPAFLAFGGICCKDPDAMFLIENKNAYNVPMHQLLCENMI
jgi:hypothetical protein